MIFFANPDNFLPFLSFVGLSALFDFEDPAPGFVDSELTATMVVSDLEGPRLEYEIDVGAVDAVELRD